MTKPGPTERKIDLALLRLEEIRSGLAMLSERLESLRLTMAPIVGHCERLMREKETLRKLYEANRFMATPTLDESLPYGKPYRLDALSPIMEASDCRYAKMHRMGRRCRWCGNTPT